MTAREDEILESANSSDGHFSDVETGTVSRIEWIQGDVRDMGCIHEKSIDVAFDKGTLDAMIHGSPWDPADDVKDNTARYLREVGDSLIYTSLYLTSLHICDSCLFTSEEDIRDRNPIERCN